MADLTARATVLRARIPTVSLAVGPTVPLPRPDGGPAGDLALSGGDAVSLPGDVDGAYLSEEELSAEWAAYVRAHQDRHRPGADGGPPGGACR